MRGTIIRALVLVFVPIFALAQTGDRSWDNLQQLRVGEKIRVVDTDMKTHDGTFLGYAPDAIALRVGTDDVGVPRDKVVRVASRESNKRLRNALIGMAIGGGAGFGIGIPLAASQGTEGAAPTFALLGLAGLGAGAAIGAASPGYRTIYRMIR